MTATTPKILYVDDDELTRLVMRNIFQGAGYEIREAATGTEALRLAGERPDLVILDVNLPDINGFEVCRRIKAHPATHGIPVLHLSAKYVTSRDKAQGLEGGADGYLVKPVEPQELLAHVKAMLRVHQAEEQARTAARQWQATFDAISDGVCLLDREGKVLRCNRGMEALTGRPQAQILGNIWFDLFPDESELHQGATFQQMLAAQHRETREVAVGDRWFQVTTDPMFDDDSSVIVGRQPSIDGWCRPDWQSRLRLATPPTPQSKIDGTIGAVLILADVSERKRLEDQLRQGQKMQAVGQLAGGIAHDFNNLLTVIQGNVALLLRDASAGTPGLEFLRAIEKASGRAAELVRQLLAYSRRTILWLKPINLHQSIEEVVTILRRTIDPRITVSVQSAADLWPVQADPSQVHQVLMNLCLNSRDAMPEGGQLMLETDNVELTAEAIQGRIEARQGQFVRLRVRDTGHGIPPAVLPRIFDPFFTTKQPGKGTGLGLALVFGIIKQHRGWIECSSEVNQGTTLTIYFPRSAAPVAAAPEPQPDAQVLVGHETILLVDDEEMICNLGRRMLQRAGYQVLLADNGEQALTVYRTERSRIDLVILDLTMPRLSGKDTLRQLLQVNPEIRVIIASGYSADDMNTSGLEKVEGFIPKPFREEDLLKMIRRALDRR
jgi:PAS domain S-box-containing protein